MVKAEVLTCPLRAESDEMLHGREMTLRAPTAEVIDNQ
jgi:hypothetical protein